MVAIERLKVDSVLHLQSWRTYRWFWLVLLSLWRVNRALVRLCASAEHLLSCQLLHKEELFLSITPSPSLSLMHTHTEPVRGTWGWEEEGGRWVKHYTWKRKSVALNTASTALYLLFLSTFLSPYVFRVYFLSLESEWLWIYTQSIFSLFSKLPNLLWRASLLWHRYVD